MEITVRMMKGVHIFKKDCNSQTSLCSPWGLQFHPFPSLVKKWRCIWKKEYCRPFPSYPYPPYRPTRSVFAEAQSPRKKKTGEARKRCRKVNHQANKKQFKMRKLEESFSISKEAMPTFMLAPMLTASTAATTTATLPCAVRSVLRSGLGWNQTGGEGENQ